jgi:hypothetical protein
LASAAAAQTTPPASPGFQLAANDHKARRSHTTKSEKSAAQTAAPADHDRDPIPPLPERKTAKASPISEPETWTAAEIDAAKARCTEVLKGLDAKVEWQPPLREGVCGTPAPVRLISLGKVTFEPPALVNCNMLQPLNTWINKDVQPIAVRQLGGKITTVSVMSDYSCRASFGRKSGRLSEHAYVDALDIRGFVTEKKQTVYVLDAWGATNRELVAAAAAVKAQAEKLAAAQAEAAKAGQDKLRDAKAGPSTTQPPTAVASSVGSPGAGTAKANRTRGVDKITVILPGSDKNAKVAAAHLGGPAADKRSAGTQRYDKKAAKSATETASLTPDALATSSTGPRARFLREAHAAACRIFGTTLGPEANEAHRNHFHVDMAERKYKKICD